MPRHRRRRSKFKLKTKTVYSLFAFGLFGSGAISLLSFTKSGSSFTYLNDILNKYFGWTGILFPFVLILLAFLFLQLKKFVLSRPNVVVGFLLTFICLMSISRSGSIGSGIFDTFSEFITPLGAGVVFLAGIFVGLVVLFDTSIDEIIGFFVLIV